VQEGVRRATADLTRAEETQSKAATEADKTTIANEVSRLKDGLASIKRQEQDRASNQQEAEAALQRVQAAYDGVEDQLSALMKTLRASSGGENK
jgi:hypothetical protein